MEWSGMGWNGMIWYGKGRKVVKGNGVEGEEDRTECSKKGQRQRKNSSIVQGKARQGKARQDRVETEWGGARQSM
jgi:hypothetical protein